MKRTFGDKGLTPRQLEILLFIMDCKRKRMPISSAMVVRKFGSKSPNSMKFALNKLKRLGLINFADSDGHETPRSTIRPTCTLEIIQ